MKRKEKIYLGDGAYYEFDGYSVKLTTENGVRATNQVYLGPSEIVTLLRALGEDFDRDDLRTWLEEPGKSDVRR